MLPNKNGLITIRPQRKINALFINFPLLGVVLTRRNWSNDFFQGNPTWMPNTIYSNPLLKSTEIASNVDLLYCLILRNFHRKILYISVVINLKFNGLSRFIVYDDNSFLEAALTCLKVFCRLVIPRVILKVN